MHEGQENEKFKNVLQCIDLLDEEQFKYNEHFQANASKLCTYIQNIISLYATNRFNQESCPTIPPGRELYELVFQIITGVPIKTTGGGNTMGLTELMCRSFPNIFKMISMDRVSFGRFGGPVLDSEPVVLFVTNEFPDITVSRIRENPILFESMHTLNYGKSIYICRSAIINHGGHSMAMSTCDDLGTSAEDSTWLFFDGQSGDFIAHGGYQNFAKTFFRVPTEDGGTTNTFGVAYKKAHLNIFQHQSVIVYQRLSD